MPPHDSSAGDPESELPAPDWYPDPWDPDRSLRWWDGTEWTGHTAGLPTEAGEPAAEVAPDAQTEPAEPSLGAEEPAESQAEPEEPADLPAGDEEPARSVVDDGEPEEPLAEPQEPVRETQEPVGEPAVGFEGVAGPSLEPTEPAEAPAQPEEPEHPAESAVEPAESAVEPEDSAESLAEPETAAEPVPSALPDGSPEEHEAAPWTPEVRDDSTGAPPGWEDRPRVMVHGEQPQATGGIPKEVAIAVGAVALIVLLLVLLG